MRVTVIEIIPAPGQTMWQGIGINEAGERVRFAGDWRPMREQYVAIESGLDVETELPEWCILGVEKVS